jgi:hypothetical protein
MSLVCCRRNIGIIYLKLHERSASAHFLLFPLHCFLVFAAFCVAELVRSRAASLHDESDGPGFKSWGWHGQGSINW